jgi:uncharacterized protein YacL
MVLHVVRAFFVMVVLAITMSFAVQKEVYYGGAQYITAYILIPIFAAVAVVLVDVFWRRKRLQVLSGLFFGLLAGLAIAYALSLIVDLVVTILPSPPAAPYADENSPNFKAYIRYLGYLKVVQSTKLLLGAAAVFVCVTFVLQTKDDFRFVLPYVEFSKQTKGARPILLDTSVIIDGRIADIAETRILESEVLVPRFILAELQAIADSEDKLKRNRGRRGLDVLNRLQTSEKIDIRIMDARVPEVEQLKEVDAKLVALAEHLDARIVTNDYNLNKIAQLRGVDVVNVNDLANALKPIVLPGETMSVKIIKPGEEPGQGVGYLEDGTMVVAEQGRDYIGRQVVITVTSVLQTSAGRMIFGRTDAEKTLSPRERRT